MDNRHGSTLGFRLAQLLQHFSTNEVDCSGLGSNHVDSAITEKRQEFPSLEQKDESRRQLGIVLEKIQFPAPPPEVKVRVKVKAIAKAEG